VPRHTKQLILISILIAAVISLITVMADLANAEPISLTLATEIAIDKNLGDSFLGLLSNSVITESFRQMWLALPLTEVTALGEHSSPASENRLLS